MGARSTRGRRVRLALVSAALVASCACASAASAEGPAVDPIATPPVPAKAPVVRLSVSTAAAALLTEARVRRLVDLELYGAVEVAIEAQGPLDEEAVRVFVDLVKIDVVMIQVQAPGRRIETRKVNVRGLVADVAARFTALAVSESVRAQLAPVRKRPPKPKGPTAAEIDAATRRAPSVAIIGRLTSGWLAERGAVLGGATLGVAFHQPILSEEISGTWIAGSDGREAIAMTDLKIGLSHRMWFFPDFRGHVGGGFALSHISVEPVGSADRGAFNLRAFGQIGLEGRLSPRTWLGFSIEPGGMILDEPRAAQGFSMIGGLTMSFDQVLPGAYGRTP